VRMRPVNCIEMLVRNYHYSLPASRWRIVVCRGCQNSLQRIYNPIDNSDHGCLKCAELDSQLEETCKELSSSQLIIKLLYKEINDITTEKTPKPTNTTSECETGVDVASSNKWPSVASKWLYNKNKARNADIYQVTQPIESANRYTVLINLPETICQDGNVAPKITKLTQISTNNCMQRKIHRRIRNPLVTRPPNNFHQTIMKCKVNQ